MSPYFQHSNCCGAKQTCLMLWPRLRARFLMTHPTHICPSSGSPLASPNIVLLNTSSSDKCDIMTLNCLRATVVVVVWNSYTNWIISRCGMLIYTKVSAADCMNHELIAPLTFLYNYYNIFQRRNRLTHCADWGKVGIFYNVY